MSLHVNLILKQEKRSASVLNVKALIRISSISIPLVLVLLLSLNLLRIMILSSELRSLRSQWEMDQPKEKMAETLSNQLKKTTGIKKELDGWQNSRVDWNTQLAGIQNIMPQGIHLKTLALSQIIKVLDNKKPSRSFVLMLQGKACGQAAENDVQTLKQDLMKNEAFTEVMQNVTVKKYGADTSKDAEETDRVFEIECAYEPRVFE